MQLEAEWNDALKRYTEKYPKEAEEFQNLLNGNIPSDWDKVLPVLSTDQSSTLTLKPCHLAAKQKYIKATLSLTCPLHDCMILSRSSSVSGAESIGSICWCVPVLCRVGQRKILWMQHEVTLRSV